MICYEGMEYMKKISKNIKFKGLGLLLLLISVATVMSCIFNMKPASAQKTVTADLRLIFTTDIHGQVLAYDYQSKTNYDKGSLSKAYTLIKTARDEVGKENTMTFDLGDCIYDYTSEYIYQQDEEAVQPVYKAMKKIGYDAVTIGNHDLDFGLSYLKRQLKESGLSDIVVSSNIKNVLTKKSEWNEVKMINKELKTQDGKKVNIKVGIIGVVLPHLSSKTEDYTGILESEDIVKNVSRESELLKENGADLIIVLSHSGVGEEEPEENYKNVSYALTGLPNVDVVLCGHEHNAFPSTETAAKAYYALPGVDKETGLANGKVLMMSKDRGRSIGVADLKLSIGDEGVKIKKAVPTIRFVESSTKVSDEIDWESIMGKWDKKLKKAVNEDDIIANIAPGESLNNYFGIIKDTNALQLFNDAKMAFGMSFVNKKAPEYLGKYPVIAASSFLNYGEIDGDDYIAYDDYIKESDLTDFIGYNKRVAIYKITGAQLREWIEWSASAYESPDAGKVKTSDGIYSKVLKDYGLSGAVRPEWVNSWFNVYFFDGVEYTIDPAQPARYNKAGQKVSEGKRVKSLNRDGIAVKDEDVFLLVTDRISQVKEATQGIELIYSVGYTSVQSILKDYILGLSQTGDLSVRPDNNWRVLYPEGTQYLVKSGAKSNIEAVKNDWSRIAFNNSYAYYKADLSLQQTKNGNADSTGPDLVVACANSETTNQDVKILVQANDVSSVKEILYLKGSYPPESELWTGGSCYNARNGFYVSENGIYSVCAIDIRGNRTVVKINVSNINHRILQKPVLKKYHNKSKTLRGTAEPGADLMIETKNKTYKAQVDADGTFEVKLPYQKADSQISVWTVDSFGRESEREEVVVKRNGPNRPKIQNITNCEETILGETRDKNVRVLAIVGDNKVYLADDETEGLWERSSLYDKKIKVVKTGISINSKGKFRIKIPVLNADTKVKVYTIDGIGRISRIRKTYVELEGPNQPVLYDVTDAEHLIYGKVPECDKFGKVEYDIRIEIGDLEYEGISKKDGSFVVDVGLPPKEGEEISAYAVIKDSEGNKLYSANRETKAVSADNFIKTKSPTLSLDRISDKETLLTGYYDISECELYVSVGGYYFYDAFSDKDGNINLELKNSPKAKRTIYAVSRYETGEIEEVAKVVVEKGLAKRPEFLNEQIDNTTTRLFLSTDEKCHMIVKVGDKYYSSDECEKDDITGEYIYDVRINRPRPNEEIVAVAKNSAGNSKAVRSGVTETAPDIPEINKVSEDSKFISGSVHIIASPDDEGEPTVKSTKTKVWIKLGNKVKAAKVSDDGTFKLKVNKSFPLKAGKTLYFWGENSCGGAGVKGSIRIEEGKKKENK